MKIVVLESLGISDEEFKKLSQPLADSGHKLVAYNDGKLDNETLKTRIKDADIIVIANTPLNAEVIDAAEKLKYISVAFTGYNHIDLDKCKEQGIKVSNAASVNQEDLLVSKIHFPDTDHVGQIYALRKAAEQRWVYFSEMKHDEVVLIKGFDSEKDGVARFTPHTAFEYPDQDPTVGARASIEVRTFAFY